MTCRHQDPINNPGCNSYRTPSEQLEQLSTQSQELRERFKIDAAPDNSKFEIIDCVEQREGIILKIRYESCAGCSYEGTKVLVYAGASMRDVLKWKVIDPHFSDKPPSSIREAPSPSARFPASDSGWDMAVRLLI